MIKFQKYRKPFIVVYILALVFAFFLVRSTINDSTIEVQEKEVEEKVDREKVYNVTLSIPYLRKSYVAKMDKDDSILDFLEDLRIDKDDYFYYEKTLYTYGLELCCINDTKTKWKLMLDGNDITSDIEEMSVQQDAIYILEPDLTRISELQ